MPVLQFKDLGECAYDKALAIQEGHFNNLVDAKRNKTANTGVSAGVLILCEHLPVYTLGRHGMESNLIADKQQLNVELYRTGRGGDITYHGPGQIVGYPVLDLEKWPMGLATYVEKLEESVIKTIAYYGIEAGRAKEAPGVWLDCDTRDERKICALGIKASRWVTMHGFAFNVNTDLSYFNNIIPCGIPDKAVTSLEKELGRKLDFREVKECLKDNFEKVFDATLKIFADPATT